MTEIHLGKKHIIETNLSLKEAIETFVNNSTKLPVGKKSYCHTCIYSCNSFERFIIGINPKCIFHLTLSEMIECLSNEENPDEFFIIG